MQQWLDARKNIENEYIFVAVDKTKGKHQIEQVQLMLGHEQIDTTMIYAKTDTKNVKYSHDKYM